MSQVKKASAPEIDIRLAQPGDQATISSLVVEAFTPFRDAYTPAAFEYTAVSPEKVSTRFVEGPIWIAYLEGNAVGTVSGLPEDGRYYMRSMAVHPSAQRVGIGQRLLDELEGYARAEGFSKVFLYTTFALPGARPLYEKNGFYIVRETPPEEWFGVGGYEMEKRLVYR